MKVEEISRISLDKFAAVKTDSRTELGLKARQVLGYGRLHTVITSPLRDALVKLEIMPLSELQVEAYKKSKEHKGLYEGTKYSFFTTPIACAFFGTAVWLASVTHHAADWSGISLMSIFGMIVCIVAGFILACLTVGGLCSEELRGARTVLSWKRFSINRYEGAIPEFALRKALQIKEACPAADLLIDHLMQDVERAPDPFLLVQLNKETYFIDVWDEKEYEATM